MPKVTKKSGTKANSKAKTTKKTMVKKPTVKAKTARKTSPQKSKASSENIKQTATPQKNSKPYLFTIFIGVILLSIVIGQLFVVANMNRKIGYLSLSMGGVIDEVGQKLTVTDQLELLGNDMNELRSYLYLPTKDYSFGTESVSSEDNSLTDETAYNQGMFMVIESIHKKQTKEEQTNTANKLLDSFLEEKQFTSKLSDVGLAFGEKTEEGDLLYLPILLSDGTIFAKLTYHSDINQWELFDYSITDFYDSFKDFDLIVTSYISQISDTKAKYDEYVSLGNQVSELWQAQDVSDKLNEKLLHVENNTILNTENEVIAKTSVSATGNSPSIIWDTGETNQTFNSFEEYKDNLTDMISSLDSRTIAERKISEQQNLLQSIIDDPAFTQVLTDYGLRISQEPIVEDDRIYYQILDASDSVQKQIAIERNKDANIIIVDQDGLNPIPLKSFIQSEDEGSKKK